MKPTELSRLDFVQAAKVSTAEKCDNGWNFTLEDEAGAGMTLQLAAVENNVLRVRMARQGYKKQPDCSINEGQLRPAAAAKAEQQGEGWSLETPGFRAEITQNPYCMRVYGPEGQLVLQENLQDKNAVGDGEDGVPGLGFSRDGQGQDACANLCLNLGVYEGILGLGERFTEYNKRGQTVIMRNSDALGVRTELAYKNIPFYLSTAGYGLFVNSTKQVEFHIGSRSAESLNIHAPGQEMEYYIFTGSFDEIVGSFTRITGPAALPPAWSFETWYSNSFKASTQQEIEQDANILKEKKLPAGVIHLDCYWLRDNCWCDFQWNTETYPEYLQMINRLHQQGYHICVWINPYVTVITDMFKEGSEKGYFVKNQDGEVYTADLWHGLLPYCAIVDFTNPGAVKWFGEKVRGLLRQGIDAIKTDFGEDIPEDGVFFNGTPGADLRNLYSRLYNEAVADVCREEKGDDFLLWARSGCTGMQKYPVCWSGDPHSSYSGMASVLKSGLSIGISGVPFWSHDIGGFFGLDSPELFVRWAQFGLLSSHSRFHGTTTRQPWAYGERAEKIVGDFMRLREKLMPYILSTAANCAEKGLPFISPMLLNCPGDPAAYDIWDQYMIGKKLLVAPVFGPDGASRRVYLPKGSWTHYFTNEVYEGGGFITITSPLEYLPLFVEGGAMI